MRASLTLMLSLALALLPHPTTAQQDTLRIGSEQTCPTCTITIRRAVSLSTDLGTPLTVARDSWGRAFVVYQETPFEIAVFGPDGEPAGTVGRRGGGPNEFERITALFADGADSLFVFDAGNARYTVFDERLRPVRSARLATQNLTAALRLGGGPLLLAGQVHAEGTAGYPLHVVEPDGTVSRSFGIGEPLSGPDTHGKLFRRIARSADGRLWSAHLLEYLLEVWTPAGELEAVLLRDAPWFPPAETSTAITATVAPQPMLTSLVEDEAGLLWVTVRIPDRDWRRGLGETVDTPEGASARRGDHQQLFDTVVEVIDPATLRVVRTARFDAFVWLLSPGELVGFRESPIGEPILEFWSVRLRGR